MCTAFRTLVKRLAGVTAAHLAALLVGLVAVGARLAAGGEGRTSRGVALAQLVAVQICGETVRAIQKTLI